MGSARGGETTANNQMLSVCNSAPLFLLARTPRLEEEGGSSQGVGDQKVVNPPSVSCLKHEPIQCND